MKNNCANKELLELVKACPNLIEKLYGKRRRDLIESYDLVLADCNMSFGTIPPSDKGKSWGYYYRIDGEKHVVDDGVMLKTKAEAQLAAVNDTRYILENTIRTTDKPVHRG